MEYLEQEADKLWSKTLESSFGPNTLPVIFWVLGLNSAWYELSTLITPLKHDDLVLQEKLIPLLLSHLGNIQWGLVVNFEDHREEVLTVKWGQAWVDYGSISKDMVSEQQLVIEALSKLGNTSSFKKGSYHPS